MEPRTQGLPTRILLFVAVIQSILFATHWFVYETWTAFRGAPVGSGFSNLQVVLAVLSISFVVATLFSFRYSNLGVRLLYTAAAVWMGLFNFFFLSACLCWVVYAGGRILGLGISSPLLVVSLFGVAALTGFYGVINARWLRVKTISVKLPNLPESWRGRTAALVTDVHLGPVHGAGFMRRIVGKLSALKPDVVFVAGDLFDGSKADPNAVLAPWKQFTSPLGTYFVTGNHEEFSNPGAYLQAVSAAGMRVLKGEKVLLDGMQIVGVYDHDLANAERLRGILQSVALDRSKPSILLAHTPSRLAIAEEAGISLQLSGHTHRGQLFPFTWLTRRIFGDYTYGLQRFGKLMAYTSSGAGTWGPPLRVGTQPELVLIRFE